MSAGSATLEKLRRHLDGDALAPAYLLAGQEPLLLIEAADAVRAAARRQGFDEREILDADEKSFDWGRLLAATQQGSLFGGSRKLIDLRLPGGKPGKDGAEALQTFLAHPGPDNVLLITCMEWGKKWEGAWTSAVAGAGWYVPVWPVKRQELPSWITARARRHGLMLSNDAIDLLALRTEGNLLACAQELEKLVMLGEQGNIDAERLDALLVEQSRLDLFAFSDAALAGDAARALRIVRNIRAEGEAAVPVISWLGGQVEILARVAAAMDRGLSARRALEAEKVWVTKMPQYESTLRRLPPANLRRALLMLARAERAAKGQESGDAWLLLERLVLTLSGAGRRRNPA